MPAATTRNATPIAFPVPGGNGPLVHRGACPGATAGCPCGAEWSYRLDTLNLAHGPVKDETFLGEPHHAVDERGYLR